MKKLFALWAVCMLTLMSQAQNSGPWKGYFSYNEIKDLSASGNQVIAASENALFAYNTVSHQVSTTNTIDGLSGQTITAIYHSAVLNRTIIGYENGLINVLDRNSGNVTQVVDILNKQLPPQIKRINHFLEANGTIYISADFGICEYDLTALQFGDTFFIGSGAAEIKVNQTALFQGYLYAATVQEGLKRAPADHPNLIDAQVWSSVAAGNYFGAVAFSDHLVTLTAFGALSRFNGTSFTAVSQLGQMPVDINADGEFLLTTTPANVRVFNTGFALQQQIFSSQISAAEAVVFTRAIHNGGRFFIGTGEQGLYVSQSGNTTSFDNITPSGPLRNNVFSINTETQDLWLTFGGYPDDYNPLLQTIGLSKYNVETGWTFIPYENLHAPGKMATDLIDMSFHPANPNVFYVSSYHSGLLKFENEQLQIQYDHTNSPGGLESLVVPEAPGFVSVRVGASTFDRFGNLWMTNGLVEDGLKVLRANNTWQSYDLSPIVAGYFNDRWAGMLVDRNNTKWFASYLNGVVGFNENGPVYKKITVGPESGNLPVRDVRSIAIDKNNQMWIGTRAGLRVLPSVDAFLTQDQPTANPVIILDVDGVPQELLYEQFIKDIAVDGANNKWIGTADAGVFLLSPNGQQTLGYFTQQNSPLPSNTINDIEINPNTGEVFIATDKGMVSYGGVATAAKGDLSDVYVYPNPVRPGFAGTVKIANLTDNAMVKIADIAGNLVHEARSVGGTVEWDTTAFGKYKVASGVYMIFIATDDAVETKVKKVMIVR